jgi:hypothetical protein
MRVLAVLGETSPDWAGQPGPEYYAAWYKFVTETVRHLQANVEYWDVFNEIDVKYYDHWVKTNTEADLDILRQAIRAIRGVVAEAKIVCCSTGSSSWLAYDKRLFDAGVLKDIDIVSFHPYQFDAPELRDGVFNYPERLGALRQLVESYGGRQPLWATEANWLLGPKGAADVTAPDLDEHTQAEYLVRVNLLSLAAGVPYFAHTPMATYRHRQLLLDALAAYANMAALLATATDAQLLMNGPQIWGYAWRTRTGVVGALWTAYGSATVRLEGVAGPRFLDMYGNRTDGDERRVAVTQAPLYFLGSPASFPKVSPIKAAPAAEWKQLPPVTEWARARDSGFTVTSSGLHVTSSPTTYGYQLTSQPVSVRPESCYWVDVDFRLYKGGLGILAIEANGPKGIARLPIGFGPLPDGKPQRGRFKFNSGALDGVRLVFHAFNGSNPMVAEFEVGDVQIARCPW